MPRRGTTTDTVFPALVRRGGHRRTAGRPRPSGADFRIDRTAGAAMLDGQRMRTAGEPRAPRGQPALRVEASCPGAVLGQESPGLERVWRPGQLYGGSWTGIPSS